MGRLEQTLIVDPEQTPQNVMSDQGYTVCHLSSSIVDTQTDG